VAQTSKSTQQSASNGYTSKNYTPPNAKNRYEVRRSDLPLQCPMPSMSLWNSHPRVYLPLQEHGQAKCPYCGADYVLVDHND
jgi:uncharacterized Zn-finger protein